MNFNPRERMLDPIVLTDRMSHSIIDSFQAFKVSGLSKSSARSLVYLTLKSILPSTIEMYKRWQNVSEYNDNDYLIGE